MNFLPFHELYPHCWPHYNCLIAEKVPHISLFVKLQYVILAVPQLLLTEKFRAVQNIIQY